TPLLAAVLAPVVVGTGVAAHFRVVPADKAVAALAVALLFGIGVDRVRSSSRGSGPVRSGVASWIPLTQPAGPTLLILLLAAVLGAWLAASTAWWLLVFGLIGVGGALRIFANPTSSGPGKLAPLLGVASIQLLAAWGTVWVELGRLPWLGLLAALLPASLVAALWLARPPKSEAIPAGFRNEGRSQLSDRGARTLFHGLLILALAVPLVIAVSGLGEAECFLPWLLAPLGEGPLRNFRSEEPSRRVRAVRQLAALVLAGSALLAVGIWAG
ncbi:MAG: hypothetical protein WBA31_09750, partial [Candidatus Dormiibacterota bacterium]